MSREQRRAGDEALPALGKHSHHQIAVLERRRAHANRNIDTFTDDVHPPVGCIDMHLHLRMSRHEVDEHCGDLSLEQRHRARNPNDAARFRARQLDRFVCSLGFDQHCLAGGRLMQTRDFDFTGSAGQRLSGKLDLPDEPPKAYAVFAHCFTCSKNSLAAARIARALASRDIATLRFDFTGIGASEGEFGEGGFSADIDDLHSAIVQMTSEGMAPQLLMGHSFGGAAALATASTAPGIKAVAVIAAPFDVTHVTGHLRDELQTIIEQGEAEVSLGGRPFTVRRSFVEDLKKHDQRARIAALQRPLLILHSPTDDIVGVNNATAIFIAAVHPKSFVSLDDADHLLTRPRDAAYAAEVIAAWASRYLE